ncbi:unnamed protein product [Arctia plantaginis]|uniref:Uncharacterized protein n=1 Tax=Arctia plantaginis TaxID=874455 RepID=A0A8S1ABT6_ARCPL|nr:unnamed protein product [Arctia plantaginis]
MILAKHTLLMFQIIACTTGLITNAKTKRSPSDSFSFFGLRPFSVQSPISRAQQSLSSFGQSFTSPLHRHTNEENLYKPVKVLSVINNDERSRYDIQTNASPIRNPYLKANTEDSFSGDLIKSNIVDEYIESKKADKIRNVQIINENKKNNKDNITSNSSEQFLELDQELINSIFQTTTEDNIDYTTGTYDENNTTTDELLRIPAAAVATLLGK